MLADLITALADDDPQPLRDYLTARGVDVPALRELPRWNVDDATATQRRGPAQAAHQARVEAVAPAALAQALAQDGAGGVALVALLMAAECEAVWEVSYHYAPIWGSLRGVRDAWRRLRPRVDPAERPVADAGVLLLEILDAEIQAENAMTAGRLDAYAAAARSAATAAGQTATLVAGMAGRHPEIAAYLGDRARSTEIYNQAVGEAATATQRFLTGGASLDVAIKMLADAEADDAVASGHDTSELRGHRFALQALRDTAAEPWLRVDAGKIVYCYPFGLAGTDQRSLVERAAAEAGRWELAGLPSTDVAALNLDDVWDGADFRNRRYDGIDVVLPAVTVSDLDGAPLTTLDARVRLSQLGNHYVRFEAALADAGPADVFAAMFRGAPEHGTVRVGAVDHGGDWPRLSALGVELAEAVGARLGRDVSARPGMFHVLVVVQAAATGFGPAGHRREARTCTELAAATGIQVLLNPVTHCLGTWAEWVRYPVPAVTNVVPSAGMRDDMILRTANTTLLVGLGSPDFHTGTRETVAEFVASLDGLFAAWGDALAAHFERVDEFTSRPVLADANAAELADLAAELQAEQVRLHDFAADARAIVQLVSSPALVSSPVVSTTVAGLLDAAGFAGRVDDLNRRINEVLDDRLGDRIGRLAARRAEQEARLQERDERKRRARMDTALAIIAAVGVSGLGQIIQTGYDLKADSALWITGLIMVLALVVGVVVWANALRGEPRRGQGGEPRQRRGGEPRRGQGGEPRRSNGGEPRQPRGGEPAAPVTQPGDG